MGVKIGGIHQKVTIILIFRDDACEAIIENWSAQLVDSDSIEKRKRLETIYKKYLRLPHNLFNVTYTHIITTHTEM